MVDVSVRPLAGEPLAPLLAPVLEAFRSRFPEAPTSLIESAGLLAIRAHQGQLRRSGEPYVTHPIAVAAIVAELGMDSPTIAAALLHDAVEDTTVSLDDLRDQFGDAVADIVDGVTNSID